MSVKNNKKISQLLSSPCSKISMWKDPEQNCPQVGLQNIIRQKKNQLIFLGSAELLLPNFQNVPRKKLPQVSEGSLCLSSGLQPTFEGVTGVRSKAAIFKQSICFWLSFTFSPPTNKCSQGSLSEPSLLLMLLKKKKKAV